MTAFKITLPQGISAFIGGLGAALMAGGLIAAAPPANAGCQYGGLGVISKCDGPVQPDGTWQRCVTTQVPSFDRSYPGFYRQTSCQMMGPDQNPLGFAYFDPLTHIDD